MAVISSVTVPHSIARGRHSPTGPAPWQDRTGRDEMARQRWKAGCMPESSAAVPAHHQPSQDDTVLFTEKLWPGAWIWLVAAGLASAGILVFAPISMTAGITAAVVLFAVETALLVLSTPALTVTARTLQVGRASIERGLTGPAEAFRGKEATAERGTRLNGLAYLCIRGWIDPVVRIEINDTSDPTPYWLTSTRRPDELVAALNAR